MYGRSGTEKRNNVVSRSVPTKSRISITTDLLDRQASEEDRIGINTKDHCKMWIQQKFGSRCTRMTKRTWWSRIIFLQKYDRSGKSTTFHKNTGGQQQRILVRHYVLQCHGINITLKFPT